MVATLDPSPLQPYEDTFEPCPCIHRPEHCCWCHGSGYRLTKRVLRAPVTDRSAYETAILNLERHLAKAAVTLDEAAHKFTARGLLMEGDATRKAAQALRDATGVE